MSVQNQLSKSLETFKCEPLRGWPGDSQEELQAKRVLSTHQYDESFNQEKCRKFMETHGKTVLSLYNASHCYSIIDRMKLVGMEEALFHDGLLAGNYDRIPAIMSSALAQSPVAPFAITRLICSPMCEQLLIQFDDEETLLTHNMEKDLTQSTWYIDKPCSYVTKERTFTEDWMRLVFSPERFLRYSLRIEEHFKIEAVAREILVSATNGNCAGLALQYAGYPTEVEKSNAKEAHKKLLAGIGNTIHEKHRLKDPKTPASALPQSNGGVMVRVKGLFSGWF